MFKKIEHYRDVKFTITIAKVINLNDLNGLNIGLRWKCDTTKTTGCFPGVVKNDYVEYYMPIELVMAMEREVSTKHFVKKIVKFSLVELDKKSKELRSISIDLSRYLLTPSSHNKVPFNNGKGILYFDIIYENIEMTNSDMKTQKTTVKLHKKRSSSNSNNDCLSKSVGNTPTQPKRVESDTSELDKIDSSKKSSPNSPIDSVVDLRVSQLLKFPMKSSSPQPECPLTSEDIKNGHYRRKSSGSSNRRSIQSPRKYSQDTTLLSPTHEEVVAFSKLKEEAVELEAKVTESKKQLNAINTELQLKTSNNYNASFDVINFFIDSVLVMDYVMKEEFTHTAHLIIENYHNLLSFNKHSYLHYLLKVYYL